MKRGEALLGLLKSRKTAEAEQPASSER